MQPDLRDAALLWDIVQAARQIQEFTRGIDASDYQSNRKTQAAVERGFSIIGEAAGRVSEAFRTAHPEIPWRQMTGQRHVLVHDYGRIDHERIWTLIVRRVPELLRTLEPLLPPLPPER